MAEGAIDSEGAQSPLDVVIVGAGITGLYQLHVLRNFGFRVLVLEAGGGIGGTWYWNRYPGCRLDSESYTYQYLFDEELLAETRWTELFASQPELEEYFNKFADRFDLRRDVRLNTRVTSMVFNSADRTWAVSTQGGETLQTRFVVTATGILSAPNFPPIPGIEKFQGELYHTAQWPHDPVDFTGKRVAVIGTGASGVQIIPVIGASAAHLTVFQRTPNWAVPLRNRPLDDEEMSRIRSQYSEIFARARSTSNGFVHDWDPVSFWDVTEEERMATFEERWNSPGFSKWFGLYREIVTDLEANKVFSDFAAAKIRERVNDPATAKKLIPTDHPFGVKRVPCETEYYETYNRPNVDLIVLSDNPILEYTPTGFMTADGPMDFDMIVLATGFDAFTGALTRIDIEGLDGIKLRDKWAEGPTTYMGVQVAGFPNLLINGGPHGKGGVGNSPRCSEPLILWIADLLNHMRDQGLTWVEADAAAEKEWTDEVVETGRKSLAANFRSYSFGDNVAGKPHVYIAFAGTLPDFVERLERTAKEGYSGFTLK